MNLILPTISNALIENVTAVSSTSNGYAFSKKSLGRKTGHSSLNNNAITLINAYFAAITNKNDSKVFNGITTFSGKLMKAFIISKPTFYHTSSEVTIQLFYYTPTTNYTDNLSFNDQEIFRKNLSMLSKTLAQLFQKKVNFTAIRLYYPYLNSSIFSQYLAHNASSNTFLKFQESILTNPSLHKTNLPGYISGIKVQVSGRLVTETVVPRITVKSCVIGTFQKKWDNSTNKSSHFIDYSKFTTKNELGAFTVKVWICQQS